MKRKIALAAPFVVTVSASACTREPKPEPIHMNPPPQETAAVPTTTASAVASADPSAPPTISRNPPPVRSYNLSDFPKTVNPRDASGRTVFLADKGSCYVEQPFGPLKAGQQRPPGTPPPRQTVPCPKELAGEAWETCQFGTIHAKEDGSECVCFHMGNPPPPPRANKCP